MHGEERESFLKIPRHVMIEDYWVQEFEFDTDDDGKHGSFTTIFSVWNGMIGTGLVSIPWAY